MRTSIIVIAGVALAGAVAWWLWPRCLTPPDPAAAAARDVLQYVASDDFAALPRDGQADYMAKLWEQPAERLKELASMGDLPDATQRKVRHNVQHGMIRVMIRQAAEYAALPSADRDAYLDGRIDEMMAKMRAMAAGGGPSSTRTGPPWHGGRMSADVIQKRMEEMLSVTTPQERAQLQAYRQQLMRRLWQRMRTGR